MYEIDSSELKVHITLHYPYIGWMVIQRPSLEAFFSLSLSKIHMTTCFSWIFKVTSFHIKIIIKIAIFNVKTMMPLISKNPIDFSHFFLCLSMNPLAKLVFIFAFSYTNFPEI